MSKNIFKQFILIILFVVVGASFLGCQKKEIVEDNKSIENSEKLEDESVEGDLEVVEIVNEDQERKPYEFAGIEIDYPEGWYYNYVDMPGGSFISNKKHENNTYPKLVDNEVRVHVDGGPQDSISYEGKKTVEEILKDFSEEMKRDIERSCINNQNRDSGFCKKYRSVCSNSDVLENNGQKYILITCRYDEVDDESEKREYVLRKGIIYQNPYYKEFATVDTATMYSYDKDLLKESDLDIVFESIKKSVISSNYK